MTNTFDQSLPSMSAFVRLLRKDGKFLVDFTYPVSGRRITKVMTVEQIAELPAKGYRVTNLDRIGNYSLR